MTFHFHKYFDRCPLLLRTRPPPSYSVSEWRTSMNARQKLNETHILGSVFAATVFGLTCESWIIFWLAAIILISSSIYSGDIRANGRQSPGQNGPEHRPATGNSQRTGQSRRRRD
jgi:hypothetical protein